MVFAKPERAGTHGRELRGAFGGIVDEKAGGVVFKRAEEILLALIYHHS